MEVRAVFVMVPALVNDSLTLKAPSLMIPSSLVSVEPALLLRVPVPLMEISALPPVLVIVPASLVRVPATLMSPVLVMIPVLVRV